MSYQIARDGELLGTFTEEELVEAVEQGTLRITDLAWTEGMEEWEPVETLIEIEEEEIKEEQENPVPEEPAPAPTQAPVQTPVPATTPASPQIRPLGQPHATTHYTAPPAAHAPQPVRYGAPPPQMVRGSMYASIPPGHYGPAGSAIASLVLGILSLVIPCLTGIPAIIFGHMARSKIRRSAGAFSGHGMAVAGLVLGYVTTTLTILFIIWLIAMRGFLDYANTLNMTETPQATPTLEPAKP